MTYNGAITINLDSVVIPPISSALDNLELSSEDWLPNCGAIMPANGAFRRNYLGCLQR